MANPLQIIGQGWGNFPNVITGGLTDSPDWTPAQLDAGTNQVIADQTEAGNLTPQQVAERTMYGTSATMPSATGGATAQQQAALGGPENIAVTQALNDRANRFYASQYNQLQNAAIAGAPERQGTNQAAAANALIRQQGVADALNRQQLAVTMQKQAMRSQVIGQLLSGAGAFAGTYVGMHGGRGLNPQLQQSMNTMNDPNNPNNPGNYTSDPNSPYNLTGDMPNSPDYLGMHSQYNMNGNGSINNNSGYGLGVSTDGLQ